MKPGRKPAAEPQAPTDVPDHEALAQDSAALTELGRRSADIAERKAAVADSNQAPDVRPRSPG